MGLAPAWEIEPKTRVGTSKKLWWGQSELGKEGRVILENKLLWPVYVRLGCWDGCDILT